MDFKLLLNVYNKPWLIEPEAGLRMLELLQSIGPDFNYAEMRAEERAERPIGRMMASLAGDITVAPDNIWDMRSFGGFDGASVAVIPITGALMKADFCGTFGTASIANLIEQANATESIKSIVFVFDTPGGTVDGTQRVADVIKTSPKYTVAFVDGMMCSAGYWIGCSCDIIVAGALTDLIGSIGTKVDYVDRSKQLASNGIVIREFTATASVDKNAATKLAIKGDGKRLVQELLDPINNVFLDAVLANRQGKIDPKQENVLSGKVYTSASAKTFGLIDDVMPFDQVLEMALNPPEAPTPAPTPTPNKNSNKNTTMSSPKTHVFQLALAAAKAESFKVVDNGFALSEEELNNIDAALATKDTLLSATAEKVTTLTAQLAATADHSTELTQAKADLKAAQDLLKAEQTAHTAVKTELATANGKIAQLEKEPGGYFRSTQKDHDPAQPNSDAELEAFMSSMPHNQDADRLLGAKA